MRKYWSLGLIVLLIGFLFAFQGFKTPPPIEEKFVVEESPSSTELPESVTATPKVSLAQPGERVLLPGTKVSYQTFNNCGPANLSMILSYYGIEKSQKELGEELRPYQHPRGDNDDKTVFPEEFVAMVGKSDLQAFSRVNGSLELLKKLLANEVPVVVKTLLKPTEDSAHFRVVRGFDETRGVIIVDDSYFGPQKEIDYFSFLQMWQPFNYVYILVYPLEKQALVEVILGPEMDEVVAHWRAINRAQKEIELDSENVWPLFNLANSYYHVGQYEETIKYFEEIELRLPRRALWYQIETLLAYKEMGDYDRVFAISERLFEDGNRAFSELYQLRGEIYLEQDNPEAARSEFELALKYNENFEPAKKSLSQL